MVDATLGDVKPTGSDRVLLLALCALCVGCSAIRGPRREGPRPIKRKSHSGPFEPHDLLASAPLDRDDEAERAAVAAALATWVDQLISMELGPVGALVDPYVELRRRLVEQNVEPALETAVWHDVAGGWTCQGPSAHVHLQVDAAGPRAELRRLALQAREPDDDPPARRTERLALQLGAALPRWEDPRQRVSVLMAIARLGAGAAAAAPAVTRALTDDPEAYVRVAAANTLGELGPDAREATSALTRSLRSDDASLRLAAATALGRLRPDGAATVTALIASLSDGEHRVRRAAVQALGEVGPPAAQAVPFLVDLLRPPGDSMVPDAAEALGKIGDSVAVTPLIEVLSRSEGNHWVAAAKALGRLGPGAAAAAPLLLERLGDEQPWKRRVAVQALGVIGAPELAAPALIGLLDTRDIELRIDVARALGALGPAAGEVAARALLRRYYEDRSWCTHDALVSLGETSVAVLIPELADLSTDDVSIDFRDDPRVRLLVSLGADAVPALLAEVRAGRLLGVEGFAFTRMGATAVPPLVEATRSDDPGLRLAALRGLVSADLFTKERVAAIDVAVEALEGDADPEVRAAAVTARDALRAQRARSWPNGRPTR
jgi:HEAT repeat protein